MTNTDTKEMKYLVSTVRNDMRASMVQRCHTLNCRPYNVAEHSFRMLQMVRRWYEYKCIEMPEIMVKAILDHDLNEKITGDIPNPFKHREGYPNEAMDKICAKLNEQNDWVGLEKLNDTQKNILMVADLAELYFSTYHKLRCPHEVKLVRDDVNEKMQHLCRHDNDLYFFFLNCAKEAK